ncbi:CCE_0567 family metalloprotein [Mesorhizobium sp. M1C.F.Ca.ET.188.01.1.1]|uniref:CCE_0567 family metalloprotein n=1 Tax=Mesorhizobium sp. M1C.F.Ca.ET.188.01.1.1 TaxID=2563924 RepID=UPI001FDF990A|nr:CCE_0567 family metalloprotein [Mesorhizobium sp. M1C.F.Ca.ET.188.01.1.1]
MHAAIAKLALQDLVEGLPGKWAAIPEVPETPQAVYAELDVAKRELASMKNLG